MVMSDCGTFGCVWGLAEGGAYNAGIDRIGMKIQKFNDEVWRNDKRLKGNKVDAM